MNKKNAFEQFLDSHDETAWITTVMNLLPEIHEVDRSATQIWFRFYPLELFRVLQTVEDKTDLILKFDLKGNYELVGQIDTSHQFLYGHRYWKEVKNEIVRYAENFQTTENDLGDEIKQIARGVCEKTGTSDALLVGITAVGLMTLVQAGLEKFKTAPGTINIDQKHLRKLPETILAERAKDDSQGIFGFLKTVDKKWTVTYDENKTGAKFKAIDTEEIASAAARDQSQNWLDKDARCVEGVIPVECRSAACGTCWVGVLGGAEKLSEVARREEKSMKRFGYLYSDEPKPLIRLACQAQAQGAVSIVIPPWNGVFGKYLYKESVMDETLEPATTSAKASRTLVKEATKNQLL
ncbi:MAG: 2Fe-2S iron-sulfur cluster-binding protein [Pyrinomonadaceae bacterium]